MNIQRSFSQNAQAYTQVNVIQKRVHHALLAKITDAPRRILDIGCGNGSVYEAVDWPITHFVGMDFAEGMLALHPRDENITLINGNFNDPEAFEQLHDYRFDRIISASALQWASDLDATLTQISALKSPVSLAIFTANTFKTLYDVANIPPLLRTKEEVERLAHKHFPHASFDIMQERLAFPSVREMFRYMKKSGVGAGRNILGYRQMKQLMERYPLDHLEYEIILIHESPSAFLKRSEA